MHICLQSGNALLGRLLDLLEFGRLFPHPRQHLLVAQIMFHQLALQLGHAPPLLANLLAIRLHFLLKRLETGAARLYFFLQLFHLALLQAVIGLQRGQLGTECFQFHGRDLVGLGLLGLL